MSIPITLQGYPRKIWHIYFSHSHELLAGAAAFAGFHEFEKHQREEGKPVTHEFAKEMLAGFAAGEADKLIETRGEDAWSAHRAREQAKENSQDLYQQYYERDGMPQQYDPDNSRPHEHVREHHRKHHDNDEW